MKWCGFTQLLIAKTVVPGSYRWLLVTYRDNLPGGGAVCMVLQCWQTQKHLLVEPPAVSRWSTEFLATEKYTATDIASTRSSTAANTVATVTQIFLRSTNFWTLKECDDRLFHKLSSNVCYLGSYLLRTGLIDWAWFNVSTNTENILRTGMHDKNWKAASVMGRLAGLLILQY